MKKFKSLSIASLIMLTIQLLSKAQSPNENIGEPVVGQPCPNFTFITIDFYKKTKATLADFEGKWLVLDFWSRNCSGCIASFPHINKEQQEFKDSVQFLMIGPDYDRSIYAKYHKDLKLEMPGAFNGIEDGWIVNGKKEAYAGIFKAFNVGTLPHIVVIDPKGIVRAITGQVTSEQIRKLLSGKETQFIRATFNDRRERKDQYLYNHSLEGPPYLVNGNGGPDSVFQYRSILNSGTSKNEFFPADIDPAYEDRLNYYLIHDKGRFEVLRRPLLELYLEAYAGRSRFTPNDTLRYGKVWQKPILEIIHPDDIEDDIATGKNLYNYSLIVPKDKAKPIQMMRMMQNDLKNYFGYDVAIEDRKMPYWRLVANRDALLKLKTKGVYVAKGDEMGHHEFKNIAMETLLRVVWRSSGIDHISPVLPLIDETDIKGKVDIKFDVAVGDFDGMRKALRAYGLDIVKGEKEFKCVVIRDPKPQKDPLDFKY